MSGTLSGTLCGSSGSRSGKPSIDLRRGLTAGISWRCILGARVTDKQRGSCAHKLRLYALLLMRSYILVSKDPKIIHHTAVNTRGYDVSNVAAPAAGRGQQPGTGSRDLIIRIILLMLTRVRWPQTL